MEKEAKKKATLSNNVLLGILGVLLILIVGLIIGVAVPKGKILGGNAAGDQVAQGQSGQQQNGEEGQSGEQEINHHDEVNVQMDENGEVDWETVPEESFLTDEEWEEIRQEYLLTDEIRGTIYPMSQEEGIQYLDEKKEEYAGTHMEFRIEMVKIWVYINADMPNEAKELFDAIDIDDLTEHDKIDYYDAEWQIYSKLGDEQLAQQYMQEYQKQYFKVWGQGEMD